MREPQPVQWPIEEAIAAQRRSRLCGTLLADIPFEQHAGVKVRPRRRHQDSSRSSRSVWESGGPFKGRGVQGGRDRRLEAGCNSPATSRQRIPASPASDCSKGLMAAIGFPRSVNTTSSPPCPPLWLLKTTGLPHAVLFASGPHDKCSDVARLP